MDRRAFSMTLAAGVAPNVTALVYVATRAPDAGEDCTALAKRFPAAPASSGLVTFDGFSRERRRALHYRKNDRGCLARQAIVVRRFEARSDDQLELGTVHGRAHEGDDD